MAELCSMMAMKSFLKIRMECLWTWSWRIILELLLIIRVTCIVLPRTMLSLLFVGENSSRIQRNSRIYICLRLWRGFREYSRNAKSEKELLTLFSRGKGGMKGVVLLTDGKGCWIA